MKTDEIKQEILNGLYRSKDGLSVNETTELLNKLILSLKLQRRSDIIEMLEKFGIFLEQQGYIDTDWRTEEPYAIDEFLKIYKP